MGRGGRRAVLALGGRNRIITIVSRSRSRRLFCFFFRCDAIVGHLIIVYDVHAVHVL